MPFKTRYLLPSLFLAFAVALAIGAGTVKLPIVVNDVPNLPASKITSGQIPLARGGTNADLSATGGANQVLKQLTAGGTITAAQISDSDLSGGTHAAFTNAANSFLGAGTSWTYTDTSSAGTTYGLQLLPTYNQTGNAGATDFLINRTQTGVGSGTQLILDAQVGGVSKFSVGNTGNVSVGGTLSVTSATALSNTVTAPTLNSIATAGNLILQSRSFASAATGISAATGTISNTAGSFVGLQVTPTYNQASGNASNTDLLINRTQTAVGSGTQRLLDLQVGGTSKFSVDNVGSISAANGISLASGGVTLGGRGALALSGNYFTLGLIKTSIFGNLASASGIDIGTQTATTVNQTGTAGATDFQINRTETAVGSGTQLLTDWQVGGNSLFNFSNVATATTYGSWNFLALQVPTGLGITTSGTAGSTTYGYRVSAVLGTNETNAATTATTTTGNATLSATNFNNVNWNSVAGAKSYNVYGRTSGSELFIASVPATGASTYTYQDKGTVVTPAGALPGNPAGNTAVFQALANQTGAVLSVKDSTGFSNFTVASTGDIAAHNLTAVRLNRNGSLLIQDQEVLGGAAGINVAVVSPALNNTAGASAAFAITPTYNQTSGTATNTDLLINRTQTAVGSGTQLLIDAQTGSVSKFSVTNSGAITCNGITSNNGMLVTNLQNNASDPLTISSKGHSTAVNDVSIAAGTWTNSSGTAIPVAIKPTLNQTATAGYTALLINPTETAVGSGAANLIDAQVGGTSKGKLSNKGTLTLAGGLATSIRLVADAASTVAVTDHTVEMTGLTAGRTASLPDATTCAGQEFVILKDGSAQTVTISCAVGGQTINGAASATLAAGAYHSDIVQSDGSNYVIVSSY